MTTTEMVEMIEREEFEAFKMNFEIWRVKADERIRALEISDRERDRQYIEITRALVRLETNQIASSNAAAVHQKQIASAFERLVDKLDNINTKLTEHIAMNS